MQNLSPAKHSQVTLPDCSEIAKRTEFCIRNSDKFDPSAVVQTLIGSAVSGKASCNELAADLATRTKSPMTREAIHQRLNSKCVEFLSKVHATILEKQWEPIRKLLRESDQLNRTGSSAKAGAFRRLVIEDSTAVKLLKSNAGAFLGHGNRRGSTAGVKIDFAYDMLSGEIISHTLNPARKQDKSIGEQCLKEVTKGDLVLRDMGYFSIAQFYEIERLGASWLSRLPLNTGVTMEGKRSLEKRLKEEERNGGRIVDEEVTLGGGQKGKGKKIKVRLVGIRAEKAIAEKRRRQRRQTKQKEGKQPSAKSLIRDGWHLMVTNVEGRRLSPAQLAAVYRVRWGVEIEFRAWKQSMKLNKALARKSKSEHLKSIILAGMIAHALARKVGQLFAGRIGVNQFSWEKLYGLLAQHHLKAINLEEAVYEFNPDPRHISRGKRKRISPTTTGLSALA